MPTAEMSLTLRDVGAVTKSGGKGTLIARTEETKPIVAIATRNQLYLSACRCEASCLASQHHFLLAVASRLESIFRNSSLGRYLPFATTAAIFCVLVI